ncbi:MAG: ABC transporter [Robiginitomaculum sp.]|nr:MAG: ABC transporter [Robiginitomaculum sp.]
MKISDNTNNIDRSAGATFIQDMQRDKAHRKKSRSLKPLRKIWPFITKYPRLLALFVFFLFAASMSGLLLSYALKYVMDCGFDGSGENIKMCEKVAIAEPGNIGMYFLIFIGVSVMGAMFGSARFYTISVLGQRVIADIRKKLYDHITGLSPSFFERVRTGEVLSRLTTDTMLIETVVGSSMSIALRSIVSVIGALIIMFLVSWKLTLMVLAVGPLIIIPVILFGRRVQRLSREGQDNLATASARAAETLSSIQTVQAFTQEDTERGRFANAVENTFESQKSRLGVRALMTFVMFGLGQAGMISVLWYGANAASAGNMTGGDIAQFSFLAFVTVTNFGFVITTWTDLLRAAGASERIVELLGEVPQITAPENPVALENAKGAIDVEDMTFSYPTRPDETALNQINFSVKPGETVALVGPSGAGKTTMFQLLLRFYDPQSGQIKIDGIAIKDLTPETLRQQFAFVQQATPLFSGSAMDNIRYGRAGASDDEVIAAAKSAFAHDFIMKLPDGYQTDLGEKALTLSGGQQQRVAIARAILRDAPILLLDEATSALDAESERAVQNAFAVLSKDRTTLVIAHRLATVKKADRIIVLEDGKIVDQGTHKELVKRDGLYARLAELQFNLED